MHLARVRVGWQAIVFSGKTKGGRMTWANVHVRYGDTESSDGPELKRLQRCNTSSSNMIAIRDIACKGCRRRCIGVQCPVRT